MTRRLTHDDSMSTPCLFRESSQPLCRYNDLGMIFIIFEKRSVCTLWTTAVEK